MTTRSQIINKEDNIPYISEINKMILATRCLPASDSAAAIVRLTSNSAAALVWIKSTVRCYTPRILLCLRPTYFGFCFAFVRINSTDLLYKSRLNSLVLRPLGILQKRRSLLNSSDSALPSSNLLWILLCLRPNLKHRFTIPGPN